MDSIPLPFSVLVSIGSALLTIGTVYGLFKSRLATVDIELKSCKELIAKGAQDLNIAEKNLIRLEGQLMLLKQSDNERTSALEELKASTLTQSVFTAWMGGQNQTLEQQNRAIDHIVKRLDGGARSISQTAQIRTTDTRIEIDSERPYDPGPVRPKLPSRR